MFLVDALSSVMNNGWIFINILFRLIKIRQLFSKSKMKWKPFVLIMVYRAKSTCSMVIQRVLFLLLLPRPRVSFVSFSWFIIMTHVIWQEIIFNSRGGQSYRKFEQKTFPWPSSNCWKMGWSSKLWNRGKWQQGSTKWSVAQSFCVASKTSYLKIFGTMGEIPADESFREL